MRPLAHISHVRRSRLNKRGDRLRVGFELLDDDKVAYLPLQNYWDGYRSVSNPF